MTIWTDKLQRVMNSATRVISDTRKFDRGRKRFLHEDLHWLDVPQRVTYKLCLLVFKCLHGLAPRYLVQLCVGLPVADITPRRKLRSATRGLLDFLRYNMTNYGRRAFSYASPHAWNSLPEHLRQSTSMALFKRSLNTFYSNRCRVQRNRDIFLFNGLYKFTYLLITYLLSAIPLLSLGG